MAQFPLTVACVRLGGISLYTLRQWCEKAEIDLEEQRSLADPRAKWLSEEQLVVLAAAHGRVLDQPPTEPELIPPAAYKLMMEQVAQALQQYEAFRADQATFEESLARQAEQSEEITRQLVALREADQELAQHIQNLLKQGETTHAALERTLEEEKQAVLRRFEEVLRSIQLHETQFAGVEAAIHQQTEQLASLADVQQQMQMQAQQAEQRLQTSFQEALATLLQQIQAEQEQQHAALLAQVQPLIKDATETAQAAQVRAEQAEQRVQDLLTHLQTLEEQMRQPGVSVPSSPRRKSRSKKTGRQSTAGEI